MNDRPRIMGVDPGVHGAIATIDSEEYTIRIDSMPITKAKRKSGRAVTLIDYARLDGLMDEHTPDMAVIEEVGSRPHDGAVAAFSFGRTLGRTETVIGLRTPILFVLPTEWKRDTKTPADKTEAVGWADKLFPLCKRLWRGPRGGLMHDRAEAAILALYGLASLGIPLNASFSPEKV